MMGRWQDIVKADRPLNLEDYLDEERAEKDYNKDVHAHNLGAGKKMKDQLLRDKERKLYESNKGGQISLPEA